MKELTEVVFTALGEASMCWSETPKGIFESTRAKEIGDRVMNSIQHHHNEITSKSWLGNATTKELLDELSARAEINGYSNYKTGR